MQKEPNFIQDSHKDISVDSIINRYFQADAESQQRSTLHGVPQSMTQKERILDMTVEQLQEKQNLAMELYEQANNTISFTFMKDAIDELREAIESLGQGSHIILVDLNE